MSLLEEHSLVTADAQGLAAMHALMQLVVRDQLTEGARWSERNLFILEVRSTGCRVAPAQTSTRDRRGG